MGLQAAVPAQVSAGFSGFRYLGATDPLAPPCQSSLPFRHHTEIFLIARIRVRGGAPLPLHGSLPLTVQVAQLFNRHTVQSHGRFLHLTNQRQNFSASIGMMARRGRGKVTAPEMVSLDRRRR